MLNFTTKAKGLLAFIGAALAGSGISVFSKIVLREASPSALMTLRFLIASLFYLPLAYRTFPGKISDWLKISAATFPAAINMVLFSHGVLYTSATMATLVYALSPIVAAIIVSYFGWEKLSLKKITGIAIGFGGMVILFIASLGNNGSIFGSPKGNLLVLVGMLFWSAYTIATSRLDNRYRNPAITFSLLLNGFWLNFILGGFRVFNYQSLSQLSIITWLCLLYLAVICGIVTFSLYQLSIKYLSAVSTLMIQYVQPVFTFTWAAILLGERLNPLFIIAGSLTLAGAYLTTTAKKP